MKKIFFERALFFSWYCAIGDCKFCYMSVQKSKIKDPAKARRSKASILAETIIAKHCGWKIEFLSGGYHSFPMDELQFLVKTIYTIMREKQWLNIGNLSKDQLEKFIPYIEGVAGTIECVNPKIRKEVCPSKHIQPILEMFESCDELGLKKTITIIIGLGETIDDFKYLEKFILDHSIERVTFYSLNPHPGTTFTKKPSKDYYSSWIKKTREKFPHIHIIAGSWSDKLDEIAMNLKAGANSITKFPALRVFGTTAADKFEKEINKVGEFQGTMTKLPNVDWEKEVEKLDVDAELKTEIKKKLESYLNRMKK